MICKCGHSRECHSWQIGNSECMAGSKHDSRRICDCKEFISDTTHVNAKTFKPILGILDTSYRQWFMITFRGPNHIETSDGTSWFRNSEKRLQEEHESLKERFRSLTNLVGTRYSELHEALGLGDGKDSRLMWEFLIDLVKDKVTERDKKLQDENQALRDQVELLEAELKPAREQRERVRKMIEDFEKEWKIPHTRKS